MRHLDDMGQLAHAVQRVVKPHKLKCELLGISVSHVHRHIFPRRADEPEPQRTVWTQLPQGDVAAAHRLDPRRHDAVRRRIADELRALRA
jgi:diadenosine tetraphosphate (Ap4A) HIT family hydrolase